MFSNVNLLLDLLLLYRKWPNSWNWKWFFLVWALPELKNCIQELFWKENMHITILNFSFETIWKPFGLSPVFFKRLRHCAVQYSTVQCSAVQCSAVQCSAVQCSAVQCSTVLCCAVQCSAVQCSAVQCSAVQCSAVPCSAVQCSTLQWPIHCNIWGDKVISLEEHSQDRKKWMDFSS